MSKFIVMSYPLQGVNLIEASAGTGKTFCIQKIVLRLVLEKNMPIEKILAVTFTEAATAELREKIRSELSSAMYFFDADNPKDIDDPGTREYLKEFKDNDETAQDAHSKLRVAILNFDMASIHTIHGFCRRMLNDCSFESGIAFDTELLSDQTRLTKSVLEDFWRKTFYLKSPLLAAAVEMLGINMEKLSDISNELMKPGIMPDRISNEKILTSVESIFKDIVSIWKSDGSRIVEIIKNCADAKMISQSKDNFREDNLEAIAASLDSLVLNCGSGVSSQDIKNILMFSESSLKEVRTKKATSNDFSVPSHKFFQTCEKLNTALPSLALDIKSALYEEIRSELPLRKRSENVQTFDDLLMLLRDAVSRSPALVKIIREKYGAVLIDEFQDTDPVQYEIFEKVFVAAHAHSSETASPIFFIGDPKQAIYSFRSADVFTYFKATKGVTSKNMLDTNFRSESRLVENLNSLFMRDDMPEFNPFLLGEMNYCRVEASPDSKGNRRRLVIEGEDSDAVKICWKSLSEEIGLEDSRKDVCRSVSAEIARLICLSKDGKAYFLTDGGNRENISPSDFAVLTRSNKEASLIKTALERDHIPAVLQNTGSVFDTEEAWLMEIFLRASADPANSGLLSAALGSRLFEVGAKCLCPDNSDPELKRLYEAWSRRFQEYNHMWKTHSFMRMFRAFLNERSLFPDACNVRRRILNYSSGERTLTNILHIAELLHDAEVSLKLGMQGLLNWLSEQRSDPDEGNDAFLMRLERDDEAVKIMTVHKSKGLEFPIVFCPFVAHRTSKRSKPRSKNFKPDEDFVYHDDKSERFMHFNADETGEKYKRLKREDLSEMMRLFYVALTRARNRVYVYGGKIRNIDHTALGYLFCSPSPSGNAGEISELDNYLAEIDNINPRRRTSTELVERIEKNLKFKVNYPEPDPNLTYSYVPENVSLDPSERVFKGSIDSSWKISSFSSLTRSAHELDYQNRLEDDDFSAKPSAERSDATQSSNKTFWELIPEGSSAADLGNCVHKMFEIIDFRSDDNAIMEKILPVLKSYFHRNGIFEHLLEPAVSMIRKSLSKELLLGGERIRLEKIGACDKVSEMEFHYPVERSDLDKMASAFGKYASHPQVRENYPQHLRRNCNFAPISGFINGKLDLVFKSGDKYYVLDWKTNLIFENDEESYSSDSVTSKMISEHYILQCGIYAKALDKLLTKYVSNYDYSANFGGLVYLFLRGFAGRTQGGDIDGVFFDRPDRRLMEAL